MSLLPTLSFGIREDNKACCSFLMSNALSFTTALSEVKYAATLQQRFVFNYLNMAYV